MRPGCWPSSAATGASSKTACVGPRCRVFGKTGPPSPRDTRANFAALRACPSDMALMPPAISPPPYAATTGNPNASSPNSASCKRRSPCLQPGDGPFLTLSSAWRESETRRSPPTSELALSVRGLETLGEHFSDLRVTHDSIREIARPAWSVGREIPTA